MPAESIAFPFGRDVDTLILCHNDPHRRKAIKALGIKAQYQLIHSPLTGCRFERIIVLRPPPSSDIHCEELDRLIREYLPTKLNLGGELFVL